LLAHVRADEHQFIEPNVASEIPTFPWRSTRRDRWDTIEVKSLNLTISLCAGGQIEIET
jgi:hypothetical protein